jgi:opacity protein-like surface antigen
MRTKRNQNLHAAALVGALLFSASAARAEETNLWSFDLVPYVWVANLNVSTSVPDVQSSTKSSLGGGTEFDTRITGGAMVAAAARYRSVGLLVDFAWLRLNTDALSPGPLYSHGELTSDFFHTTAALTYRLPFEGKFHADLQAGLRAWHVNEDLDFGTGLLPGFEASGKKSWVDPIVGTDLRYDLSDRWFVTMKGNVGGFGVSSEMAYDVFAGVGFHFTDWFSTTLGYRYLYENYDRDHFKFDLKAQGFLLGFGFHF